MKLAPGSFSAERRRAQLGAFAPKPSLLVTCHLSLVTLLLCATCAAQSARRPNVLVILVDDLGYGDLGSYGARDLRTPNIDALVASGVRFDNFYANSPVCSPTRAALMTGRYPDAVGVPGVIRTHADNSWGKLSSQAVLLPQVLRQAGYRTALIGKWHLGLEAPDTPNERGFDYFHGFLGDMMDDYYTHRRHDINYMRRNRETITPSGHATDLFSNWAVDFLNTQRTARAPFFLYLAYNAPHVPLQPPPEQLAAVKQREPNIGAQRARLVALIEHMDAGIGRVLAALGANNQANDTLIVFTSDNGGQTNVGGRVGSFRGSKQDLYEGGLRVPFAAAWPNRIAPNSRSEQVALTMDLFPTVAEAAGVTVKHQIDGASLLPLWRGENSPIRERDLFWMRREGGAPYFGQDYYAVRRGPWKLLHNTPFAPLQLYNLESDPGEQKNLVEENPKIYADLLKVLQLQIQRAGAMRWQ